MMHRQIRTTRNPKARGFIVRALERIGEVDELGNSTWRVIHSEAAGTKRKADALHGAMHARFVAGRS